MAKPEAKKEKERQILQYIFSKILNEEKKKEKD